MPTAFFVDAGFFLKRFRAVYPSKPHSDASVVAKTLHEMALGHLTQKNEPRKGLYRIFVYDCPPLLKKAHKPISKTALDFGKTDEAQFRLAFHEELKSLRKTALRLGRLQERGAWRLNPHALADLLSGARTFPALTDDDFAYDVRQKGTVDQIVLVAGDADFVPAAKLARREGVDFILDPMWGPIAADLHEHIDGLRSTCPRPTKAAKP